MEKSLKRAGMVFAAAAMLVMVVSGVAMAMGESVDELVRVWGEPDTVCISTTGATALVYNGNSSGHPYVNRYFVVADGKVVEEGLNLAYGNTGATEYTWTEAPTEIRTAY